MSIGVSKNFLFDEPGSDLLPGEELKFLQPMRNNFRQFFTSGRFFFAKLSFDLSKESGRPSLFKFQLKNGSTRSKINYSLKTTGFKSKEEIQAYHQQQYHKQYKQHFRTKFYYLFKSRTPSSLRITLKIFQDLIILKFTLQYFDFNPGIYFIYDYLRIEDRNKIFVTVILNPSA